MVTIHALRVRLVGARLRARATLLGLFLLLAFLAQGVFFIRDNAPTYDEALHLAAGYSHLATADFRLEPQNPPLVRELLALPLFLIHRLPFQTNTQHWRNGMDFFVGQDFLYDSQLSADQLLLFARLPNLLIGGLLVVFISWWAYRLWGPRAALLAMALASFEPNFIAHAGLVTTDIGTSFFFFLTIYLLWEYLNYPGWRLLVGTGLSLGAALVTKFSVIVLIPLMGLILLLDVFRAGEEKCMLPPLGRPRTSIGKLLHAGAVFMLILGLAAPVISAAYLFRGVHLWVSGLERFLTLAQEGQPGFFLGEYSYQGWWNYFLVAFLLKTPLGSLTLMFASLLFYRIGSAFKYREAVCLLLPVAMMFVATSQSTVDIGLRHILPVYPFLFVLASRLTTVQLERRWLAPALIGLALSFTMISSLRIAPHQLAYFNESIGGPGKGYRYLADSNLDWGQDLKNLKAYMDKEKLPIIYLSYFGSAPPSYYGIRYQYVPGSWPLEWPPPADIVPSATARKILAMSVNNLQDIATSYEPLFRWLRLNEPIAKIGYSIFVYDLTKDPAGQMMLDRTYALAGLRSPSGQSIAAN